MTATVANPITIPSNAQEAEALRFAYDTHTFDHAFAPCATCADYESALCQYEDDRDLDHRENMDAIAMAEHRAYGECYQFEGDECAVCDEYHALMPVSDEVDAVALPF